MKTYIFIVLLTHVFFMLTALRTFKKQPKKIEFALTVLVLVVTLIALAGQTYYAYFYS